MEFLPVGKRTRGQKAKMLNEQKKRLCLAARRKWMEMKGMSLEVHTNINGGKKVEALEEDVDDDDAMVIDENEYLKAVNERRSEKTCENEGMSMVKKEIYDYDYDNHENPLFNVVNGDESSDDSVQIVGERWNPFEAELCFDLDDEDYNNKVGVSGETVALIDFELSSSEEHDTDDDGSVDDDDGSDCIRSFNHDKKGKRQVLGPVKDDDEDDDGDDDGVVPCKKDEVELPRKFRLEDEKIVPQKSEYEQELEHLFKELDFGLGVCEIGMEHSSLHDKK